MRFWVGTLSAGAAGIIVGIGAGILLVEDKLKKEYDESTKSMRRAFEAALIDAKTNMVESPAGSENDLIHLSEPLGEGATLLQGGEVRNVVLDTAPNAFGEVIKLRQEESENPYHRAVAETSPHLYASYAELEEEDYMEEDGRVKEQFVMTFEQGVARFFHNGEEIDDALERVGGSIVDNMREAVEAGNPVLWIRNNNTEVDYEVIFEQP